MKKLIFILLFLLLTLCFSEDLRVEIIKRYDNGNKKVLFKYKGEGIDEVVVERIAYSENGDTLILEKPLDKMQMVREYYEDGQIKGEGHYKDGERDGKEIFYYKNGKIRLERTFKMEKLVGLITSYYEHGQIEKEGYVIDGKEIGLWIFYYENGQIEAKGSFKDGKHNGKWTVYHENGSIDKIEEYKNGELLK